MSLEELEMGKDCCDDVTGLKISHAILDTRLNSVQNLLSEIKADQKILIENMNKGKGAIVLASGMGGAAGFLASLLGHH